MPQTRFSPKRVGASYPLAQTELVQARSALHAPNGVWGRFILRITNEAHRERAEYWFGAESRFHSIVDDLPGKAMQEVKSSLDCLFVASKGYHPEFDANDSGRSLLFWHEQNLIDVFVPDHLISYQPSKHFLAAFEKSWELVTR